MLRHLCDFVMEAVWQCFLDDNPQVAAHLQQSGVLLIDTP